MRVRSTGAQQIDHGPGELEVALEDRVRTLAPRLAVELVDGGTEPAELGAGCRRRGNGVVAFLRIGAFALRDERRDDVVEVRPVEARNAADVEDFERVEAPGAGGHDASESDVVVGIGDGAHRLLEIADLRRGEQAQPADHGVRDVLVAQPRDDRLAVLVLTVEDGRVRPVRVLAESLANAVDDGDGLVLGTAAHDHPDIEAFGPLGSETLVRFESRGVASDEPIRSIENATHRSEVLLDPPARWRAGWRSRPGRASAER